MDPQLQTFVAQRRQAGINDAQIRQELQSVGWQEADIASALGQGGATLVPPPVPAPMPAPAPAPTLSPSFSPSPSLSAPALPRAFTLPPETPPVQKKRHWGIVFIILLLLLAAGAAYAIYKNKDLRNLIPIFTATPSPTSSPESTMPQGKPIASCDALISAPEAGELFGGSFTVTASALDKGGCRVVAYQASPASGSDEGAIGFGVTIGICEDVTACRKSFDDSQFAPADFGVQGSGKYVVASGSGVASETQKIASGLLLFQQGYLIEVTIDQVSKAKSFIEFQPAMTKLVQTIAKRL